jgi:chemotaxis protein histidine kinase CheA
MSQSIQFLRSTTPGQKPVQLSAGQIAFNLVDKLMFVGDGSNLITDLAGNATSGVAGKGFFTTDLDISSAEDAAKAYTDAQISALVDGAPGLLDTLKELAAALGDDSDFASTIANSIAAVQAAVDAESSRAAAAEAALSSDLANEISRATAAEEANASAIAAEASRAQAAEASITTSLNAEAARAQGAEATLSSDLAAEVARAEAAEASLSSDLATEVARAEAAEGELASDLADEVARAEAAESQIAADLTAEVTRAQDEEAAIHQLLANEVLRAQGAESVIASDLVDEINRAQTEETALAGAIASEANRAIAAEGLLDSRLDDIEENLNTEITTIFENNAAVIADASGPSQDSEYRQGWYFTNATAGDKINWYFFDGMSEISTLGSFSAYAVFTLDSVADVPFLGVYTKPTGTGDSGSWYHSRQVWVRDPNFALTAGKTYLIHTGNDPKVHPELTRIPLVTAFNSVGDQDAGEQILTVALNTDSSSAAGNYQFLVDSLGVKTESGYDRKSLLRFRQATVNDLNFDFGSF